MVPIIDRQIPIGDRLQWQAQTAILTRTASHRRQPTLDDAQPSLAKPNRREHILATATALFTRHGVHAVTTRQIAAQVGISQPSLYAHFASIQQIQDEVSARAFALLEHHSAAKPGVAPAEQLRHAIASYVTFGLENPQAYRIAFMLEHPKPPTAAGWDQRTFAATDHPGPRAYGHLRGIVAQLRPDLKPEALDIRTQCLWASLHGLIALLIARPDFPWTPRAALIAEHSRLAYAMVAG